MATPLKIATYHQIVIETLKTLPWVKYVDTYPEEVTQLLTPAIYISVDSWKPVANSTGQLEIILECSLYIVIDRSGEYADKPDLYVRAAAADLTQWIEGQQFGIENIQPAVFLDAGVDEFDPRMDAYHVWRISYEQAAAIGDDPFAATGGPLKSVFLGKVPNVGSQHLADYQKIWEENDG